MSAAARPVLVAETRLLAGRSLRHFFRQPQLLIPTVVFSPLLMFILLAAFGQVVTDVTGGDYVDRLAPLICLSGAGFGAAAAGLGLLEDRQGGMLGRLRAMPIDHRSALTGRLVGDFGRILLVAVVVVALAHLPGFRFEQGPLAAFGFFVLVLVFGSVFTWASLALGVRASSAEAVQSTFTAPVLLLFFLSSGFVPAEQFPALLEPVVRANPMSCCAGALVGLSSGGPVLVPVAQTLAWVVVLTAVFATAAVRGFRSA